MEATYNYNLCIRRPEDYSYRSYLTFQLLFAASSY